MKKLLLSLITTGIACMLMLVLPVSSYAEEDNSLLISDLKYDEAHHVLRGKTSPNANISLSEVVGIIYADESGSFEMPIPEDLQKSTITIVDYIDNKSTDVNYDFVAGAVANSSQSKVEELTTDSTVSKNKTQSDYTPLANKTTQKKEAAPEKKPSIIPWVILLVILIAVTVLVILAYRKRQLEEKAQERALAKKKHTSKRKHKKKKNTPN